MTFSLLLAFDTDHPEFVRGFELGRIWAALQADPDEPLSNVAMHVENAEMALRVGEATSRTVCAESLAEDWLSATFGPSNADE